MTEAIFARDGDAFVPTALAIGPWDPSACHGGAPAALLAALVEQTPTATAMQTVRLTYDLLRPVPLAALTTTSRVVRDGRRVQVVEIDLATVDGTELVRCRALRIRTGEVDVPPGAAEDDPPPAVPPDELDRFGGSGSWDPTGFWEAVDVRFVDGTMEAPGPATCWFRVVAPLAEGVALTPLARAAAAADFGNGIGSPVPFGPYVFINPDLTVQLHRDPAGEWVAMSSRSVARPSGVGLTSSILYDEQGRIGAAGQTLFVDRAP